MADEGRVERTAARAKGESVRSIESRVRVPEHTLEETAEHVFKKHGRRITWQRVRQIEIRALEKIRKCLMEWAEQRKK